MSEIDSHKFACAVAQFLDDKLAKDITILNISNVSSLADYFVIATGDSTPQVKALMETVKDKVKTVFSRLPIRQENDVKNIFLGHLSKENNYDKLAYETVRLEIDMSDSEYRADDFDITVANRDIPSKIVEI